MKGKGARSDCDEMSTMVGGGRGGRRRRVEEEGEEGRVHGGGRWVDKITRDLLGGEGGLLEFTVIGYGLPGPVPSKRLTLLDRSTQVDGGQRDGVTQGLHPR